MIPKKDFGGQLFDISMMELRASPGKVMDRIKYGAVARVIKAGKHIATIVPVGANEEVTFIGPNGMIKGRIPLTYRRPGLLEKP